MGQWNFDWCLDVLDGMNGLSNNVKKGILSGEYKMIADPDDDSQGQIMKDVNVV